MDRKLLRWLVAVGLLALYVVVAMLTDWVSSLLMIPVALGLLYWGSQRDREATQQAEERLQERIGARPTQREGVKQG